MLRYHLRLLPRLLRRCTHVRECLGKVCVRERDPHEVSASSDPRFAVRVLSRTLELGGKAEALMAPEFSLPLCPVWGPRVISAFLRCCGQIEPSWSCKSGTINQLCDSGRVLESP